MWFPVLCCVIATVVTSLGVIRAEERPWNRQKVYPNIYNANYQRFRHPLYNNAARKSQLGNRVRAHASYYGANNYQQYGRGSVPFPWSATRRAYQARPYPYGHFIPFKDWSKKGMPRNFVTTRKDNKSLNNVVHATSITQQGASRRHMNAGVPAAWQKTLYSSQRRPLFIGSQARTGYTRGTTSFWGASPATQPQHLALRNRQSLFKTKYDAWKPAKRVPTGVARPVVQVSSSNIKAAGITNRTPGQVGNYLSYHEKNQGNYDASQSNKVQKNGPNQQVGTFVNRLAKFYASPKKVLLNQVTNDQKVNNVPYSSGRAAAPAVTIHINPQVLPNKVLQAISKTEVHPKPTNKKPATTTSYIPPGAISSDITQFNVPSGNQPSSTYQGRGLDKTPIISGRAKSDSVPLKTNKLMWSSLLFPSAAVTRANVHAQNSVSQEAPASTTNVFNEKMKSSTTNINKLKLTQQSVAAALNNSIREDLNHGALMQPVKLNNSEPVKTPLIHVISLSPDNVIQQDKDNLKVNRSDKAVIHRQVAPPTYIQIRTNTSELGLRSFLDNLAKLYVLKNSNKTMPTLNGSGNKASLTSQTSNLSLHSTDNINTADKKDMFTNTSLPSKDQNVASNQPYVLGQTETLNSSVPTDVVQGQSPTAQADVENQIKTLTVPYKTIDPAQNTPSSFQVSVPPKAAIGSQTKLQPGNGTILNTAPFQVPVITIKPVIIKVAGNDKNFLAKAVNTNTITGQVSSTNTLAPLPGKRVSSAPPVQPPHIDYGIMGNDSPQPSQTGSSTTRNHIPGKAIIRTFNGIGNGVFVRSQISNAGRTPSDYRRTEIPRPALAYSQTQLRMPLKASGKNAAAPLLIMPYNKRNQALKPGTSFGISRNIPRLHGPMIYGKAINQNLHKQFQRIPQTNTLGTNRYNLNANKSPYVAGISSFKTPNTYISRGLGQRKPYPSTQRALLPYKGSFPLKLHKVSPYFGMKRYLNNNVNDIPRVRRRFLELRPRTRRRFLEIEGTSGDIHEEDET